MNLLKFELIELIEKHKKTTAVAEQLSLKQPTVSFHMKNLEQEFGVPLFESKSGKTMLTEAGQALHHYAVRINALAHEAKRVVKEFDKLDRGSLKIGASYVPGTYLLPKAIGSFNRLHPGIRLSLVIRTGPVIQDMLLRHEIDMGFISSEPLDRQELIGQTVCEDTLVLIFSPAHPFSRYGEVLPEQIAQEPFICHSMESATRQMTEKWRQQNGIELNRHMETDSLEAIKQIVMLGEGISMVSRLAVEREVERGDLKYLDIPHSNLKRHIYSIVNRSRYPSSMLTAFLEHMDSLHTRHHPLSPPRE